MNSELQFVTNLDQESDSVRTIRTLNDAELIRGGATFKDGRLHLTENQISEISMNHAKTIGHSAIVLIPYSKEIENSLLPQEVMNSAEFNRRNLNDQIESVTLPYIDLFRSMIPANKSDSNTKLFKRFQKYITTPESNISRQKDDIDTNFTYAIRYKANKIENSLDSVFLSINDSLVWPNVTYSFNENSLACIYLKRSSLYRGDTIKSLSIKNGLKDYNGSSIKIILDPKQPQILLLGQNGYSDIASYRFDPLSNDFTRISKYTNTQQYPTKITNDDFINIIKESLDIFPTTQIA